MAEGTQAEAVGVTLALALAERVAFTVVEGTSELVEEMALVEDEAASCAASASAIDDSTEESTHAVEELP